MGGISVGRNVGVCRRWNAVTAPRSTVSNTIIAATDVGSGGEPGPGSPSAAGPRLGPSPSFNRSRSLVAARSGGASEYWRVTIQHEGITMSGAQQQFMMNKVPLVTLAFWIIKILATTVGETGADFLNFNLGFGLTATSLLAAVVLIAFLWLQFRQNRYVPWIYWLTVVFLSIVGTLITDNLSDNF